MASDIWVCAACRSVNSGRARSCYRCRTPKDRAAVDPSAVDPASTGRAIPLPPFQSPRPVAVLATVTILAAVAIQLVGEATALPLASAIAEGQSPEAIEPDPDFVTWLAVTRIASAVLGLITWALWLSMAVRAMPALGLGYPQATGTSAFFENLVPILNVFRVPSIVRDLIRRLHPEEGRGDALVFVALVGLLGAIFVPRVGGILIGLTSETEAEVYRRVIPLELLTVGLLVLGATALVALMWWLELQIGRRRTEQLRESRSPQVATPAAPIPATQPPMPAGITVTAQPMGFASPPRPPVAAPPVAAAARPKVLKKEPLVGMPPIRALGITNAGAMLRARRSHSDNAAESSGRD